MLCNLLLAAGSCCNAWWMNAWMNPANLFNYLFVRLFIERHHNGQMNTAGWPCAYMYKIKLRNQFKLCPVQTFSLQTSVRTKKCWHLITLDGDEDTDIWLIHVHIANRYQLDLHHKCIKLQSCAKDFFFFEITDSMGQRERVVGERERERERERESPSCH